MITQFYSNPQIVSRLRNGPWGPHIDSFAAVLFEQGYARASAQKKFHLIVELHLWLSHRRLTNGLLEGINSLIQAAKAKARGYRSRRNLITIVYLIAGRLDIQVTHKI